MWLEPPELINILFNRYNNFSSWSLDRFPIKWAEDYWETSACGANTIAPCILNLINSFTCTICPVKFPIVFLVASPYPSWLLKLPKFLEDFPWFVVWRGIHASCNNYLLCAQYYCNKYKRITLKFLFPWFWTPTMLTNKYSTSL